MKTARFSDAQVMGNLLACKPTGQRYAHRILTKLVCPCSSHSSSPLLQ